MKKIKKGKYWLLLFFNCNFWLIIFHFLIQKSSYNSLNYKKKIFFKLILLVKTKTNFRKEKFNMKILIL
jgi:hypothetical protein